MMEERHLFLKTYGDVKDRSPLYCGSAAVLFALMAWREFSNGGEFGLRFCLMLLTVIIFVVGAVLLVRRHRTGIEVTSDPDGKGEFRICRRGQSDQVVCESRLAYVKREKKRMMIHYYEGEDLRRLSFSTRGASKKDVQVLVGILESWLKND